MKKIFANITIIFTTITSLGEPIFSRVSKIEEQPIPVSDFFDDLEKIRTVIFENHPGIDNPSDPDFREKAEKNFQIAEQTLLEASTEEGKIAIMEELGRSFRDAHLRIRYDSRIEKSEKPEYKNSMFAIEELKKDIYRIILPTFAPSQTEKERLENILRTLPLLRDKTLVFDLRGNQGGNSSWGEEIVKALFGEGYATRKLNKLQNKVSTDWRASPENLQHIQQLIPRMEREFGKHHPATEWIKNIRKGIESALLRGEIYYSEMVTPLPSSPFEPNRFTGRLFVIIDRRCISACLDCIDYLKAMHIPVTFIGETTGADSIYMEIREVSLPSGKGKLVFPIKVYRNRPRGDNVPHIPDIVYPGDLQDTEELKKFIVNLCKKK